MNDKLKGKSVPWKTIQNYITAMEGNQTVIGRLIALKDDGLLEVSEVETKATQPIF